MEPREDQFYSQINFKDLETFNLRTQIDFYLLRMFSNQKSKQLPSHYSSQFKNPTQLLLCSITSSHKFFSTSDSFYFTHNIDRFIRNKKSKLRTFLNDQNCNRQQQHLQKFNSPQDNQNALKQLTEYYKFYTQTTILYIPEFFKIMHENREKKKVVEYNRLKKLLDLSDSNQKSQSRNKNSYQPLASFHLVSILNNSLKNGQQTMLFAALKQNLNKALGPNHYNSIDEIDKDYYFQQKVKEKQPTFQKAYAKKKCIKLIPEDKEAKKPVVGQKPKRFRRNISSESLDQVKQSKRFQSEHKTLIKKKHQSMDNLSQLKLQNCETPPLKRKKIDCWFSKFKQNKSVSAIKQTKVKIREVRTKYTQSDEDYVKQTIKGFKQKIRKQKCFLKKKLTAFSEQGELPAKNKKLTLTTAPKFNNATHKVTNFHFF